MNSKNPSVKMNVKINLVAALFPNVLYNISTSIAFSNKPQLH